MRGKTHAVTGALVGIVIAKHTGIDPTIAVFFTAIGAYAPDIDHPESTVGRRLKVFSTLIAKTCGHRGLMHSILGTALFSISLTLLIGIIGSFIGYDFFNTIQNALSIIYYITAGYLTHLAGDMLTKARIPLFYPSKKLIGLGFIKSGGFFENIIFVVAALTFFYQLYLYFSF
ncbi:MAG: metal-dependent hydrolase [bacterium]